MSVDIVSQYEARVDQLLMTITSLNTTISQLNETVTQLTENNSSLASELAKVRGELLTLKRRQYGRSSEKLDPNQLSLFDSDVMDSLVPEDKIAILIEDEEDAPSKKLGKGTNPPKKTKKSGRKEVIINRFDVIREEHKLEGEACRCSDCQNQLKEIGVASTTKEVVYQEAKVMVVEHVNYSYVCRNCSEEDIKDHIVKTTSPKQPISGGFGSASVIAQILHQKFILKVPTYRQEEDWKRMGLPLSRRTMSDYIIKSSERYFSPLYNLMKEALRSQTYLHADETPYRVLESDKSKNYYWVFLSGIYEKGDKITLYHFDESRRHQVADDFLEGFHGYLHSDMYGAYLDIENTLHVGCWAHVRRDFHDAYQLLSKKEGVASRALEKIAEIYHEEKKLGGLSPEVRLEERQKVLKPLVEAFFEWCKAQNVLHEQTRKAIQYTLNHKSSLMRFLEDGHCVIDNNIAERAVKQLVMGRKNWLFSSSIEGAKANAVILSLIETAKRNDLDPVQYLHYLLKHLPNENDFSKREVLEAYLPWAKKPQECCKVKWNDDEL